jgi:predicted ester cyclase
VVDLFRMYRVAFPDLRMDAVDVISSADKAVARVTATGTQTGEFMGMAPSGRSVSVQLIDIMRFDDAGLVCEHWGVMDTLSMLQQLGAIPDTLPA